MRPLRQLGFRTIGLFDPDDPRQGHESTLDIIALGERLGFDSAWVRHRHLQYGQAAAPDGRATVLGPALGWRPGA